MKHRNSTTLETIPRAMVSGHTMLLAAAVFLSLFAAGCATHRVTLHYVDLHFKPPIRGVQPIVEGSINGVSGHFVVDTGAMGPTLTQTAIQRCGLAAGPSEGHIIGMGGTVAMMQATNVTVRLGPDFTIYWRTILVLPQGLSPWTDTNADFFGVLDYRTLSAGHAVMDMQHKTITLSK